MSGGKKITVARGPGKKRKEKAPTSPSAAELSAREHKELERIRNSQQQQCLMPEELDPLERKVDATAGILNSMDWWDEDPTHDFRRAPRDPEGNESDERKAWRSIAEKAQSAQHQLLRMALRGLLCVIEHGKGEQAQHATSTLLSQLVETINDINRLARSPRKRKHFRDSARMEIEFPALLSMFRKENLDLERFVRKDLELGAGLPFAVDSRKPYTTYTLLAMKVVRWIDSERRSFWFKSELVPRDSVYRKVVPDLDTKDFFKRHATAWGKVIAFHLDFFQAPKETQKKTAFEFGLESEWEQNETNNKSPVTERNAEGNLISWSQPRWLSAFWEFGEITKIPEFQSLLKSGKDKNVKSESDLYGRVKHKVVAAALGLMKE